MRAWPCLLVAVAIAASLTTCAPAGNWITIKSGREQPDAAALLRHLGMAMPPATIRPG